MSINSALLLQTLTHFWSAHWMQRNASKFSTELTIFILGTPL
ncbi:MAG: hypothetical protein QXE05_12195 [Nitrososphaeria archaeon]